MTKPVPISVVMTAYNSARYIREAVESILNQSFGDFEFIIVDNHSSDDTVQIISSYKDPRIIFIRNETNLGQTKALNIALHQARGRYIARMDADDVSDKNRLKIQLEFLELNPSIAVVGSFCQDIDESGRNLQIFRAPHESWEVTCSLAASGDLTSWCISHPSVCVRKELLEEAGFYSEIQEAQFFYPQDYDLWSKMLLRGCQFANIPQPLLKYRILEKSESRERLEILLQYRLEITRKRITAVCPDLKEEEIGILTRMLEFLPQESKISIQRLFALFDRYFDSLINHRENNRNIALFKIRMKLYYIPILFLSHPRESIKQSLKILCKYPVLSADLRFYRKIIKVFLMRTLSKQNYSTFTKKRLSFR